jgi:lysophospholipase L1-like esterase
MPSSLSRLSTLALGALLALPFSLRAENPQPFAFENNDRVVLLGSTIIEREQKFGELETQLTLAVGDKNLSVRNLGWSGDSVFGIARSYFGPPTEGLDRLSKHLDLFKPTVLVTCYGDDVALDRDSKISDFIPGYEALLNLARSKNPATRFIIIAPPPFENLGAPLPDMDAANAKLAQVRDALKEFAEKQHATFVDTFTAMGGAKHERPAHPLTDNGLHYADAGYRIWAAKVVAGLGFKSPTLSTAETETLRHAIIEKDRLFFDRWRPENETYLFGFRKHEQGQNAVEVDQFEPLVEKQDQKIAQIKAGLLAGHRVP